MLRSLKTHFSKFLNADSNRLHFAPHSHHCWPDVTFEAHTQSWLDAAKYVDDKWSYIFRTIVPEAQAHVAKELGLPDSNTLAFAPNTHEFVVRLLSCLPPGARVVTSDSEFHSFDRQTRRLEEEGRIHVHRVASEPFGTFTERLATAAQKFDPHLVFVSQVFFNSAAAIPSIDRLVDSLPTNALIAIDGYHAFTAIPINLSRVASRIFYIAGGYKYAMAGEGACFMHVPPSAELRPPNTGWFAAFGALESRQDTRVAYAPGGAGFWGATFDPSGLYRLNAAMRWRQAVGYTADEAMNRSHFLSRKFALGLRFGSLSPEQLVVRADDRHRGHFLTFRVDNAKEISAALHQASIIVDARDDRLRFGFGAYHDEGDVDALLARLNQMQS